MHYAFDLWMARNFPGSPLQDGKRRARAHRVHLPRVRPEDPERDPEACSAGSPSGGTHRRARASRSSAGRRGAGARRPARGPRPSSHQLAGRGAQIVSGSAPLPPGALARHQPPGGSFASSRPRRTPTRRSCPRMVLRGLTSCRNGTWTCWLRPVRRSTLVPADQRKGGRGGGEPAISAEIHPHDDDGVAGEWRVLAAMELLDDRCVYAPGDRRRRRFGSARSSTSDAR
jgi:hypothetical protein